MDANVQDMFTFFIGCLCASIRPRTGRRVEKEISDFGLCGLGPKIDEEAYVTRRWSGGSELAVCPDSDILSQIFMPCLSSRRR